MSTVTSQRLPLISVIIPTYNRAALLRRAIDSVYAQEGVGELFDVEVLVIDDGSTDTTPTVASSYEGLRYIRPSTNKGTSGARNVGLDAAVGEYVAFLDDDDSWLPWKLRRQLQVVEERSEVSLVYGQEVKRSDRAVWVWPDPQDSPTGWMHRLLRTSSARRRFVTTPRPGSPNWTLSGRPSITGCPTMKRSRPGSVASSPSSKPSRVKPRRHLPTC